MSYSAQGRDADHGDAVARSDHVAGADHPAFAARVRRRRLHHRLLERRQPDPGAVGAPGRRAGGACGTGRQPGRAAPDAAGRKPGVVRRRCRARRAVGAAVCRGRGELRRAFFGARARCEVDGSVLWIGAGLAMAAAVLLAYVPRLPSSTQAPDRARGSPARRSVTACTPGTNRRLRVFATAQIALSFVLLAGAGMLVATLVALQSEAPASRCARCWRSTCRRRSVDYGAKVDRLLPGGDASRGRVARRESVAVRSFVPWRDAGSFGAERAVCRRRLHASRWRGGPARAPAHCLARGFSRCWACRSMAGRQFTEDDRRGSEPVVIVSQSRRAAVVSQWRSAEPEDVVDRSVLRQAGATPRRRHRGRYR